MKAVCSIVFLLCLTMSGIGQGIFGVEGGMGQANTYNNYQTPTLSCTYFKYVLPHVYFGASMDWRFFSFTFQDPLMMFNDPNLGVITSIDHHSSYLFLSPTLDISIGENQYIHLNLDAGPGVYLGGSEQTLYETNSLPGTPVFNSVNTTAQNNKLVYQIGYGLTEYIPTRGYWSIKLSQQFCTLGRNLNSGNTWAPGLVTGYSSFTIGISHYYKRIFYKY